MSVLDEHDIMNLPLLDIPKPTTFSTWPCNLKKIDLIGYCIFLQFSLIGANKVKSKNTKTVIYDAILKARKDGFTQLRAILSIAWNPWNSLVCCKSNRCIRNLRINV